MNNLSLSDEVKKSILIAQSIAKEYSNPKFSPAHLLRAILHKEFSLRDYLDQAGKDFYFMEDWADVRIESTPKGSKVDEPTGDDKIADVFVEADNIRIKLSKNDVDLITILAAISTPGIAFSYDQLKTFPISVEEIMSNSIENAAIDQVIGNKNGSAKAGSEPPKAGALYKYCIDKCSGKIRCTHSF